MISFIEQFSSIRRPGILIRAAQYYLESKCRAGGKDRLPPKARTDTQLHRLIDDEHHLEEVRRASSAEYDLKAHIETLAELIAAASTLRNRRPVAV